MVCLMSCSRFKTEFLPKWLYYSQNLGNTLHFLFFNFLCKMLYERNTKYEYTNGYCSLLRPVTY